MRKVDMDEDVYSFLEGHARGFEKPNDVLRRLLLPPGAPAGGKPGVHSARPIAGALADLISKGLIEPGDVLSHVQVRKGLTHTGEVEADGWVRTKISKYREPSPALSGLTGSPIDGWKNWVHDRSGKSLRQLRTESGGAGRDGK